MPLNYPLYKIGDRVRFTYENGPITRELDGVIQSIDEHGVYENNYSDTSYDIEVDGLGWIKHISEIFVTKL